MASGQVAHIPQSRAGFPSIVLVWKSMALGRASFFPPLSLFTPPEPPFIRLLSALVSALHLYLLLVLLKLLSFSKMCI